MAETYYFVVCIQHGKQVWNSQPYRTRRGADKKMQRLNDQGLDDADYIVTTQDELQSDDPDIPKYLR